ncbi:MAG: ECF transporter S component [Clostridia bacterium]|nr:ECF transporter S component [Clostridia bacterium]
MGKKLFTTKNIAGMGVFVALSFILYLPIFEIPLFAGTPYKLDFSNLFVLLGGFMYGPFGGIIILLIKELLHIPLGGTGGVGELANTIIGLSFILFPTILYRYKKGLKVVIFSLIIACVLQIIVGVLANKFILLPFFKASEFFEKWFWFIVALNAIKSICSSLFSIFFYKKLSFLFRKINLQEK